MHLCAQIKKRQKENMEIQNLSGSRVVHAPESSNDLKSQASASVMKSTLLSLKDIPN